MTLVLHEHPFAAYCWKPLIAFYDRGVPFERVNIGGDEDRARLTELWPTGNIPVLVDSLRPEHGRDPYGVDEARATLDRAYPILEAHERLEARPSVKRVIDEARFFREFFPLGWPDHVK
ncbi:glutathione S-transferase N-terminal domain-containing protein [Solirubrobacter phytolaccae]|uniref:Glutathione S-transferase N-terminal domain-containing protein n=1 Tax=Solirubrobacter phytolaccae TaxID=1404360 RepID=A0A9X3SC11_9ACTN|nr:glutathione S-transferase N-terminal domain-containing protein [Solirubrobacter phytolaccae]MDA0184161.1 glutathione S-transferase N-terminal domain-containing protein [Solirubrobacter phytolaccae]